MDLRFLLATLPALALPAAVFGQHQHPMPAPAAAPVADSARHPMVMPTDSARHSAMTHAFSRHLPMSRNGSGTAWQPDASPMYMGMQHRGPWMTMLHGQAFLRYTNQNVGRTSTQRGGSAVDGPNWLMAMAQRTVGRRGLLNLSLMLSLDPLTETLGGYPLLFQSGEAYKGQPLVDKQHPHDLFAGLTVGYTHAVSEDVDLSLYVGYPGEPALGPTAFMHRLSAMPNPDAPLSHHWVDATHITYGVATAGVRWRTLKLEASNFTGREPDEHRYDFDRPRADSWSGRLQWNPGRAWALQMSRGVIHSPEARHPQDDLTRTTASVLYTREWAPDYYAASALVWGLNESGHHREHAALAETNLRARRFTVYGRYEFVQKAAEELAISVAGSAEAAPEAIYNIHALTLGAAWQLATLPGGLELHAGAQGSAYRPDARLFDQYGQHPVSAEVYLRLNAPRMRLAGGAMGGMKM